MAQEKSKRFKNSVGIWAFGPTYTRFMPSGYHPEAATQDAVDYAARAREGLGDLVDGYEFHYPQEVNEKNCEKIREALEGKDIYALALGTFSEPRFAHGSFINPDKKLRRESIDITKAGIELAGELGSKFMVWPGGEGYNYPFQIDYVEAWDSFISAIGELTETANNLGVTLLLEHKSTEPAMRILMRDIGMTIFVIKKVGELGVDTTDLKINMDWMHLIMNGEPLGEYAALLCRERLLGHHHGNSGWGTTDDDNMVGALFFMQTLDLAFELIEAGYGSHGERVGFDLFPYTEDQVEAVRESVLHWEFICDIARALDRQALKEAKLKRDAVACYREVYRALGLDRDREKEILERFGP